MLTKTRNQRIQKYILYLAFLFLQRITVGVSKFLKMPLLTKVPVVNILLKPVFTVAACGWQWAIHSN